MKNTLIILFIVAALASCKEEKPKRPEERNKDLLSTDLVNNPRSANGGNKDELAAMPTMNFIDSVFDFGTIKEGDVVSHEFEFTNSGKNPLIISSAKGSCGCTVPEYPNEPIPPGKSNKIRVQFNSASKEGHQEKSVTLTTNSNKGIHMLYIKGNVKK